MTRIAIIVGSTRPNRLAPQVAEWVHEHAQQRGLVHWDVSVDSTIARAHQHATNVTRRKKGLVELQESAD